MVALTQLQTETFLLHSLEAKILQSLLKFGTDIKQKKCKVQQAFILKSEIASLRNYVKQETQEASRCIKTRQCGIGWLVSEQK